MKKFLIIFLILFFLIPLSFFGFLYLNSFPVSSDSKTQVFIIGQGDSLNKIGAKLEEKKIIKNKFSFIFFAYWLGLNKKLQSGSFRISPSLSTQEIIIKISKGGSLDYWLKIKDGSRIEEIANLFPNNLSFTSKEFLFKAKNNEGKLFPDSYLIPQYFDIDQILNTIEKNFANQIDKAKINATNTKLSENDILILASLLEREGRTLESKQKIAGILMNRLEIGMPLQIDATVQFARDSKLPRPKEYWQPITKTDINLDSSFNTYKNRGLPPLPICNPGYNSLFAAYHPISSDNFFYITDDDGIMHYAKTLEEHNKNIQKYLR